MAVSATIRLQRVIDLEEKQGWRNRAVIGGIRAMAERWSSDAQKENIHQQLVSAVVGIMHTYDAADPAARPELANQLRSILATGVALPSEAPVLAISETAAAVSTSVPAEFAPPVPPAESPKRSEKPAKQNTERPQERPPQAKKQPKPKKEAPPQPQKESKATAPAPAPKTDVDSALLELPEPAIGATFVYEDESIAEPEPVPLFRPRSQKREGRSNRNPRDLQSAVTILPGVGESTAEQLARLGINKVIDLLWHLPTRHEDYSTMRTIAQLRPGEQVTVIANLWEVKERKVGINRQMVQGILADGTGTLHATWWNRFITKQLTPNETYRFSGKISLYMGQKTIDNPTFEDADKEMIATGRLAPIYPLTEGVTHKRLRNLIYQVLDEYSNFLNDPLPKALLEKNHLPDLASALWQIHFPDDAAQLEAARKRLAFEELFYIQLGVFQRRRELQQVASQSLVSDPERMAQFQAALPFPLTGAQQRVIGEIEADLKRNIPMTRLVQGDVGSGKTAVAAAAMWVAVNNGTQSALLAPTQILAEQHYRGINRLLSPLTRPDGTPLSVELLTGRVTGSDRERVLAGMSDGTIDIVIGTTALIQEHVEIANLGVVVVDEQHRFGVEQRGALRTRSEAQPHLLVMSATPIPRSLALTLYGDLDLSIIDEMPPGRIPIQTKLFHPSERERLYSFMRREAKEGRQAFIIYPLVEESDKLDVGAAVEAYERLSKDALSDLRLALLHGRMSGGEKDEVMRAFADRQYDVLVSTSVIEVGIDIPNASLIMIEDADRFGLAQLHQFRGRVGRGQHKSYCALISGSENATSLERLRALEATTNGFVLAEKDLALRGPGDFLGTRQSGLPNLHIAHLSDLATLTLAREAAQELFEQDPLLDRYPQLAKQVSRFWRGQGDVN
ncbi:MAG: ATP-dependent DNA helicase RecG [Caldilineaceae bacterium]